MGPDSQAGVRVDALLHPTQTGHALRQPRLNNLHAKGSGMSIRPSRRQRTGKLLLEEPRSLPLLAAYHMLVLPSQEDTIHLRSHQGRNAGLNLPEMVVTAARRHVILKDDMCDDARCTFAKPEDPV